MKKLFIYSLSAIALLASCAKEIDNSEKSEAPKGKVQVTILAQTPETKTTVAVDGSAAVYSWQTNEHIAVVEEDATEPSDFSVTTAQNAEAGAFTGTVTAGKSLLYAVSPAGDLTTGTSSSYTITLPAAYQNYVPGTTNAVLFGTPDGEPSNNTYKFQFDHIAALVKVTYKNVPVGTKYLKFSTDKKINGAYTQNNTSKVELGTPATGTTETKLELAGSVVLPNQTMEFFIPVPAATYTEFHLALYDKDDQVIAGTSRSKTGIELELEVGDMFVTPQITLSTQHAFFLIGYKSSEDNSKWILMDPSLGTNSYYPDNVTNVGTSAENVSFANDFASLSGINDYIWKVDAYDGAYSIQSMKTEGYVACTSNGSNAAYSHVTKSTSTTKFTISLGANNVATIKSTEYTSRVLQYNASSPRFAFYTGNQQSVYFIPATYDERANLVLSFDPSTVSVTTANYNTFTGQTATATSNETDVTASVSEKITYSIVSNVTGFGTINETSGVVTLAGKIGSGTVTATFPDGDATYRKATATYTINVTDANAPKWKLVESTNDVEAGDYIITWDNTYYLPNSTAKDSNPAVGSGISVSSKELTNTITDAMIWQFTGNNTDGFTVSAKINDNTTHYLQSADKAQGISIVTSTTNLNTWKASIDNDYGMLLKGSDSGTRYLAVYSSQDWRYYATGNNYSGTLRLYKLEDTTPKITAADITVNTALGVTNQYAAYSIKNFAGGDDVTVKEITGCVSAAVIETVQENNKDVRKIKYSVSPNYGTQNATGTIVLQSDEVEEDVTINVTQAYDNSFTHSGTTGSAPNYVLTIPNNATTASITVTSSVFGYNTSVAAADQKNLTISSGASGNASASAQTIIIASTEEAPAAGNSALNLGTVSIYRNNNASDPQMITIAVKKAAAAAAGGKQVTIVAPPTNCTVAVTVGGSPISSGDSVAEGSTVTLAGSTTTPAVHAFDSWIVYKTGDVNTTISVTNNTFEMPAYAVTIKGVFTTTVTKTMSEIVSANNFTVSSGNSATCYTSFNLDSNVSVSTSGSANCGSFWGTSPNHEWRLYQNKSGDITISALNGYAISKITITYGVSNTGTLKDGSTTISSNSAQTFTNAVNSKTYTVGNTGNATNGQVKVKTVSVTYK